MLQPDNSEDHQDRVSQQMTVRIHTFKNDLELALQIRGMRTLVVFHGQCRHAHRSTLAIIDRNVGLPEESAREAAPKRSILQKAQVDILVLEMAEQKSDIWTRTQDCDSDLVSCRTVTRF